MIHDSRNGLAIITLMNYVVTLALIAFHSWLQEKEDLADLLFVTDFFLALGLFMTIFGSVFIVVEICGGIKKRRSTDKTT